MVEPTCRGIVGEKNVKTHSARASPIRRASSTVLRASSSPAPLSLSARRCMHARVCSASSLVQHRVLTHCGEVRRQRRFLRSDYDREHRSSFCYTTYDLLARLRLRRTRPEALFTSLVPSIQSSSREIRLEINSNRASSRGTLTRDCSYILRRTYRFHEDSLGACVRE